MHDHEWKTWKADITQRPANGTKGETAALNDIRDKLDSIFGTMPDGLIIIDEYGTILHFTAGAKKLFGYRQDEVFGKNVKLLMPSPYREAHDGYLSAYRETGVKKIIGVGREVSGQRKDGSTFPLYLSIGEIYLEGRRYFVGVTHDLTRVKRVEERLLTLSAAVGQSPAAVMIASKDGAIEYVNSCFTRLTGYSAEELIGHSPGLLQSRRTPSERHRRLWDTISSGREWRGEIEDRKKSGELYWAHETITPLRDADGEVTHYLAIQQDITAQKRDKEALAESEQRFRQVAKMAGEWIWEQDAEGRYIYSSGAVADMLGLSPEEILGRRYTELLDDDSPRQNGHAFPEGKLQAFRRLINHYRHRDGHKVFTESSGAPIFDELDRLIKWRGLDHDITSHKLYEDALRVRDRAIESVHIGIVISDAQAPGHPNIYVNPALCEITGYTRDELLGNSMKLLQGPETDPAAVDEIRRALSRGETCEVTLKNYRKDGTPFWNELLISPVIDEDGKTTHYIGIQTDVTERRKAEESRHELEIARHIQLSLLPSAPLKLPRVELAGVCLPAAHVGGDYFDFFENSGVVDIVIADVSGHSVGAALIMTEVRSTLRAETRKADASVGPAQVLRDLNDLLHQDLTRAELFITMFYFRFLPQERILKFANAGHNLALLLRAGAEECAALDADGLVLGVKRGVNYEERSVTLDPGDKLLFYTDGVVEAESPSGEFFGLQRLCDVFQLHRDLSPELLIRRLREEISAFCGNTSPQDDIAIVIMEVL
jgi:sigma-B regulation protein RsbU (phosphoserine phosphatase)